LKKTARKRKEKICMNKVLSIVQEELTARHTGLSASPFDGFELCKALHLQWHDLDKRACLFYHTNGFIQGGTLVDQICGRHGWSAPNPATTMDVHTSILVDDLLDKLDPLLQLGQSRGVVVLSRQITVLPKLQVPDPVVKLRPQVETGADPQGFQPVLPGLTELRTDVDIGGDPAVFHDRDAGENWQSTGI
jgi:hypothetical protein